MKFKIKDITIKNQVVLAPMAGISNSSFMKIVEEMGLGLAYTELISAEAVVRNNKKTFEMLNGIGSLKIPIGVQLFGSNNETLAKAAKIITDLYPNVFIDINMGCPVPKVAIKNQAGSALLKNLDKIFEIISSVVNAVNTPVTVKIRSGWDATSINAVEVARTCESAGASAITIHGRTRAQGYSGKADWNIIKDVKAAVNIPVIGNGDVTTCYLAKKMLAETNCDAVMIGRGVLGNPWLIKECIEYLENGTTPRLISNKEKLAMILKHYELLLEDKIEQRATLEMKGHILYYLKSMPKSKEMKAKICMCKTKEEILEVLNKYKTSLY